MEEQTMKKNQYIKPAVEIVVLQTKTMMLTGSDQNISIGSEYNGGAIGSRQGNNFFEDDEDY